MSPGLRARALAGWPRFGDNLAMLRSILIGRGCDGRLADCFGSVLAAAEMLLSEHILDSDSATEAVEIVWPAVAATKGEAVEESDARRCWLHLLTSRVDAWRGGDNLTIGQLLLQAQERSGTDARRTLAGGCGIRLDRSSDDADGSASTCCVANQHAFLTEAFRETVWRGGGWRIALQQLEGARPSENSLRIGGIKQRVTIVPQQHLPRKDDPEGEG